MNLPDWSQPFLTTLPDSAQCDRAIQQIQAAWPAELPPIAELAGSFVDRGAAFAHLLSISPVAVEKLVGDPAALVWLARPEIHDTVRGPRRMRSDYAALQPEGFDPNFRALRRAKAREMLRIALREVAGWATVEQTTLELTQLAELCVRAVCDGWMEELSKRLGSPQTDFAVLGMGKFGGQELNYSSDIDVIFFYGEDGQLNSRLTNQEFFTRVSEKIIGTFAASDPAGPLFRIDLRLRPEGASGPLVRSLDGMENYYSGFGETWERMALIKARVVAGSEELGYEFTHRLQPFIYPRTVSLDVVEEIRAIKGRIEREIVGESRMRRNVKLGYGGIREIEFVTQTLQILNGARHAFLQDRSTLKTLGNLRQLGMIPVDEMEALIDAYRFLRTVEHRLQIEREAQTHTLPESREALERLAASLRLSRRGAGGSDGGDSTSALAEFEAELARQTQAVRTVFDRVLSRPEEAAPEEAADLSFFQHPEQSRKTLEALGQGPSTVMVSARTRRLYARLEPLLLEQLRRVADPDAALTQFIRFVERYGLRGLLFETLLRSPRVLELLIRLFDASRSMTEIVLRRPQLIEEIARGQGLGDSLSVNEYLTGLMRNDEGLAWEEWERAYRRAQVLRIGLRDVLGFASVREVQAEYSALAEACLVFTQRQLGFENELTVIAMGKFGGRELSYGADMDVLFIGENLKAAAELIKVMSARTAEGVVFQVDPRLRPEGEAGLLAVTLPSYAAYFEKRAQVWEAQALTKARPVIGPQQKEFLPVAQEIWRRFGQRDDLFAQIGSMLQRVVRDRAGGDDALDFKTGGGGLMQVEFFAQANQMRAGLWEPNTLNALMALGESGVIPRENAERLHDAYLFLRKIEAVLRRMEDTSVSKLPADELEQTRLAIRAGLGRREKLLAAVHAARSAIRELAAFPA